MYLFSRCPVRLDAISLNLTIGERLTGWLWDSGLEVGGLKVGGLSCYYIVSTSCLLLLLLLLLPCRLCGGGESGGSGGSYFRKQCTHPPPPPPSYSSHVTGMGIWVMGWLYLKSWVGYA